MDPNATLSLLRELVAQVNSEADGSPDVDTLLEFVELFEALDEWMSRGGFSPWATVAQT